MGQENRQIPVMLENINLKKKQLSREEYKRALPDLQRRLYDLEKACWDQQVSTIVVIEGLGCLRQRHDDQHA